MLHQYWIGYRESHISAILVSDRYHDSRYRHMNLEQKYITGYQMMFTNAHSCTLYHCKLGVPAQIVRL